MDIDLFQRRPFSRRSFIRDLSAAGIGVTSLAMLSACGGEGASGPIRIKVTDAPASKEDAAYEPFHEAIKNFEREHKNKYDIVPSVYQFQPESFYARMAGGQQEDATRVYFTEPQYMIANNFIADVTDHFSKWEYFDSVTPEAKQIVSNKDGRIFAIPRDGYKQALTYNRKLFKDAGLDPNKPPKTWEEFMEYSRVIKQKTGAYGYMAPTTSNTGGWVFTTWLYSAGGRAQKLSGNKWLATFNEEEGVAVLEMFKKMRWDDKTMPELATINHTEQYKQLAQNKVAMVVGGSEDTANFVNDYKIDVNNIGVGPLPVREEGNDQAGALGGGNAWIFRKSATPEILEGAVLWTLYFQLRPENVEASLKAKQKEGKAIGFPDDAAFSGRYKELRDQIIAKYITVPEELTKPYFDAKQKMVPEPPIQTQKYYNYIDDPMQKILSSSSADPKELLDAKQADFQRNVLDQLL